MTITYTQTNFSAHGSLRDQIATLIGVAPDHFSHSSQRPWSSVRFSGTRHEFVFACETPLDPGAAHRLAGHEFLISGEIVVDATIASTLEGYRVEALTVEAG